MLSLTEVKWLLTRRSVTLVAIIVAMWLAALAVGMLIMGVLQ